jgi:hypothetical protein
VNAGANKRQESFARMKRGCSFLVMQFFVATKLQNKYGPSHSGVKSVALRHRQVFAAMAALVASYSSTIRCSEKAISAQYLRLYDVILH